MPKRNTKGEGSVYKDEKSNKWIAQLRWTDKKGEKHKKTFKRKRKTEAQAALNDFKKKTEIKIEVINKLDYNEEKMFATRWEDGVLIRIKHSQIGF